MMSGRTRFVFLDVGNVILDLNYPLFAERLRALTGLELDGLRQALRSGGLSEQFECGRIRPADFHRELCGTVARQFSLAEFTHAWNSIFLPQPLISEELLAALAARADLWIISNTNEIHFQFVRHNYGFLRHFRGWILSHEVGAAKPDEKIFRAALQRAGAQPGESVFTDDHLEYVQAAQRLGIDAFHFVDAPRLEHEMRLRGIL